MTSATPCARLVFSALGLVGLISSAMVGAGGCAEEELNPAPPPRKTREEGDGINASGVGAGTGANTGLPCEVQQLLENRCIGCHLATTPYPLLTYENLLAPPPSDRQTTMAEESLARMRDIGRPMPPPPALAPTPSEIDVLQAWVTAGKPKGAACTSTGDGGVPSGGTNYDTPSVCTSQRTWNRGDEGSGSMRPGGACMTCHTMRGGPRYEAAGTVYPTAHEPNECNGIGDGLSVVVTDANGTVTQLPVNSAGNFYSKEARIVAPFRVKVTDGVKERVMAGTVTAGDCNTCHTERGVNGAPGRVLAP